MSFWEKNRGFAAAAFLLAGVLPACGLAQVTASAPASAQAVNGQIRDSGRFVVVLDAAHGGDDSGAQLAGSTAEKTVTLALNVRLRSLLSARGVQVVTTREENVTLDYDARAQVANHAAAAACISIHATEAGAGVHIFVSSLAPVPLGTGGQTHFLAWKTAQAAFITRSLKLASVINSTLEQVSAQGSGSASGNSGEGGAIPVTLARTPLPGVDSMACPAVAVEVAPLRGPDHKVVTEVTEARYQAEIAEALAAAVLEWRNDWQTGAKQP